MSKEKLHTFHRSKVAGGTQRVKESELNEEEVAELTDRLIASWNLAPKAAQDALLAAVKKAEKTEEGSATILRPKEAEAKAKREEAEKAAKEFQEKKEQERKDEIEAMNKLMEGLAEDTPEDVVSTMNMLINRGEVKDQESFDDFLEKLMAPHLQAKADQEAAAAKAKEAEGK